MDEQVASLAKELNVSEECANDVFYLRSRSRWSSELEAELIALHKAGKRPDINEFGCTPETAQALLESVREALGSDAL